MLRFMSPACSCRLTRSIASFTLTTTLLTTGLGAGFASIATAQQYIPPSRGLPGRREGGGTRGGCVTHQPSLTALTPQTGYGLTTRSHPTWFWYVPPTTAQSAEFVLFDQEDNEIYTQAIELTGDAGIIQLTLPDSNTSASNTPNSNAPDPATSDSAAGLEVGQNYHWYFALICDAEDRSGDVTTEGWIQRIEPDAALTTKLEAATAIERPSIYAASGVWYDAIDEVVELRQTEPRQGGVQTQWQNLLKSVELQSLSNSPFLF